MRPHLIMRPSWLRWRAYKVPPPSEPRALVVVARSDPGCVTGIRLFRHDPTRHEFVIDYITKLQYKRFVFSLSGVPERRCEGRSGEGRPAAATRTAAVRGESEGNRDEGEQTRAQQRATGT